jgi:hypothetical protein
LVFYKKKIKEKKSWVAQNICVLVAEREKREEK